MKSYDDNNQFHEKQGTQVKDILMALLILCWLGVKISNYIQSRAALMWCVGISFVCAILTVILKPILERKQENPDENTKFKR